jgi:hypothetical protein
MLKSRLLGRDAVLSGEINTPCLPSQLFMLDCLTLKMKAKEFFETLGNTQ